MKKRSILTIEVDDQGRAILPAGVSRRYGFTAGAKVRLEEDAYGLRLSRASANLARIYIEPTNRCNLDCLTCMRNVWDEAPGTMSEEVFRHILDGVRSIQPAPSVLFGGYGEPLVHPCICEMVEQVRHAGAVVELITNGILLSEDAAQRLLHAGLDRLWVSLDGATPQSYADVRLGASLPLVIDNLRRLKELRAALNSTSPRLGIAFVAMKRNIADLPELVRLGKSLGADQFSISNVLPHTPELRAEMLYGRSAFTSGLAPSEGSPLVALPRLDIDALTGDSLVQVLSGNHRLAIARQDVYAGMNTCPFVEKASVSVRWDGAVSPCQALLHTHQSYLGEHVRTSAVYTVGRLQEHSLAEIWNDPAYIDLRERLIQFDFSPCTTCNSCEMAETNQEDCFGNVTPACGGCLWAQGFIQCP